MWLPTFSSRALGVAQLAKHAASIGDRPVWYLRCLRASCAPPEPCTADVGVGHEEQSLSDVRRTDARSAEIDSPDGVVRCFQVSVNKVEPTEAVLARNLFSKHRCRLALPDEL